MRRADGAPVLSPRVPGAGAGPGALGRRLRRLCRRRDAATRRRRGRADRGRLRAAARDRTRPRRRSQPGAPRGLGRMRRTISASSIEVGDKAAVEAAFARAASHRHAPLCHQPGHRGGDGAARRDRRLQPGRRPLHDLHDACSARTATAPIWREIINVPESRVRVVAGDIGGSFRHEIGDLQRGRAGAAGLEARSAGRSNGPARAREAFLSDAQARDNVTEAELALDKRRQFPRAFASSTIARSRRLCAARTRTCFACCNLGTLAGVYRTPAIHAEVHRRLHQHQPDAALSRQRPARGRLCHRAHGRRGRAPSSASTRSSCAAAT